jgi:hypothetical protein
VSSRPWMAHPKRRDNLRLVLQGIVGFLVLMAACIVIPGVG